MINMLVHDIMQIQLDGQSQTPNPTPQAELSEPLRILSPPIGWHDLSNATCFTQASFVLCAFRRVRDRHSSL